MNIMIVFRILKYGMTIPKNSFVRSERFEYPRTYGVAM